MTDQQQTKAQRLAALLRSRNNNPGGFGLGPICDKAADELLRLNSAHADLERMSMQLAACGVVAMADTPDSAREARAMHPDYESASCDDVKRRVDECIELRARVAELEDVLTNLPLSSPQRMRARIQRLEEMLAAVGAGGVGPLIPATVQHQRDSSSDNELQRKTGDLITTAAPPQTGGIPPNWQLVPMEATGEMIDAARGLSSFPDGVYRNMLAAAPQPPTTEQSSAVQPQVEQEPGYLDGGSRYKVTHLKTSGYCIIGLPGELLGCWVALVDATDNKHIDGPQPKREPLTKPGEVMPSGSTAMKSGPTKYLR